MYLNETDPWEVFKLQSKLDTSKAADIFCILPNLIKIEAHILCFPLAQIFNKSFEHGVFPSKLKIAKVMPIHKSESTWKYLITDQFHYYLSLVKSSKK